MKPKLRSIFYYITYACNLRCLHCYMGDHQTPPGRAGGHADGHADLLEVTHNLQASFLQGARQVVFLGGEPTLHPAYADILSAAASIGYSRIVVDTNGCARDPLPGDRWRDQRLGVRISFEGIDESHDRLRGRGSFRQALACLRKVVAEGVRAEVTFTLHAHNCAQIEPIVHFFAGEGVHELNFHFVSLTGRGSLHPWLGLTPAMILEAQDQLESLRQTGSIRVRFPRLLVRQSEWPRELAQGLQCRLGQEQVLLIFPGGQTGRCPLEIAQDSASHPRLDQARSVPGCPRSRLILPAGVPEGYFMTCISWKQALETG